MRLITLNAAVLAAAGMCACATKPAHLDVDWQHGAKHGWVAAIYGADTPRAELPACLADLSADELAHHHYVRVGYRHVRVMHTEVAELPPDVTVQLGEKVELWPADCDKGRLSRISRILPPAG